MADAGDIESPTINSIPAGAVLSFNYLLQTENAGGFDVSKVFISANSGAFNIQSITLNQTAGEDILIAGRTTSDTSLSNLNTLRTHWISGNAYATRITNLRTGVGSPLFSLKATINVFNDGGEDDVIVGGGDSDWYFRALDDVITDLVAGELIDVL
jgi:hypothetical protein